MNSPATLNLPNQITLGRLFLSLALFGLLPFQFYLSSLVVFLVAASTDWADGYFARKYNLVTKLGRILDPFVDKLLICGAFIYLAAEPQSGIGAWMAVIVVARELLVTVLRSFFEGEGVDFSANRAGKLKMVFQCAAVVASLWALSYQTTTGQAPLWVAWPLMVLVWLAVISTLQSGTGYVWHAYRLLRR